MGKSIGFAGLNDGRGNFQSDLDECRRRAGAGGSAPRIGTSVAAAPVVPSPGAGSAATPVSSAQGAGSLPHAKETPRAERPASSNVGSWVAIGVVGVIFTLPIVGPILFSGGSKARLAETASVAPAERAAQVPLDVPRTRYAHVIAVKANVRSGPGTNWGPVAQLDQLEQVKIISEENRWSLIEFGASQQGYVSSALLAEGSYEDARRVICSDVPASRPYSGEVLKQTRWGSHQLTVNAGADDVLVKLRDGSGTVLAFFVNKGQVGVVSNVPEGSYQVMFATGEQFSRSCLEFMSNMEVTSDPNPVDFLTTVQSDGYQTYTNSVAMQYTLTRVAHGNFRPTTVDDSSFRE